ncbi:aspartate kinase [Fervidicella metallireducens AeB]|uniref:Aspartokinase n=1 Tax=Fervidicella metallireducens AeB TaxID=1403537 RepID=A0A017RW78_9CLOT|nr:aspartate kinase [Fervidicella metallireducens]EYE88866.1 aspartate kinase [Fervidicella metallireducens AeB]
MAIIVQKYGGSSVATIEKIKNVAKSIINKKNQGNDMVVVVSAMGDTTDDLINLAKEIATNPCKRELDALLATGEMVSSALLAMAIKDMGYDAVSFNAYQIQLTTNGTFGKSLIEDINEDVILSALLEGKIVIIAGFQGISEEGEITTLGRGGSDTSAVAIAAKLSGQCEIYTDVDGIYSVDPRLYKEAKKIDEISYEEMLELSSLGAQVMHSRSVELGEKYNIPIYVGLSCSDIKGTYIREVRGVENKPITGIAAVDSDVAITLKNIKYDITLLAEIFQAIAAKKINIDMISQTTPDNGVTSISFTIPKEELRECLVVLRGYAEEQQIFIDENICKFSVVGIGMKTTSGVAAKIFKLFSESNIEAKMITTSEIRITCAIKSEDKMKAVALVAKEFEL